MSLPTEFQRIIDTYAQEKLIPKTAQRIGKGNTYIRGVLAIAQYLHGHNLNIKGKYEILKDKETILELYKTKSLTEISKILKIPRFTISYALNYYGIPIKRWGEKSKAEQMKIHDQKLPQQLLDKQWLIENYETKEKSLTDIAEELRCSISPVRYQLRKFGVKIHPPKRYDEGQKSSSSYGVITHYIPVKCPKKKVIFRSLLELSYAFLLDSDSNVKSWDYEVMWTFYIDGFNGKQRKYICDFRVEYVDGVFHHVEVKPLSKQTFVDKYLYAKNVIENWRFISEEEIEKSKAAFLSNDLSNVFIPVVFQKSKKFIIWSKSNSIELPPDHRVLSRRMVGQFCRFKIINDGLVLDVGSDLKKERPKNLHEKFGKDLELNLDGILSLVKEDKLAREIGLVFGCNYKTIIKFLEDRSYVVDWHCNSSRHNVIWFATKKLWPLVDLPPREAVRTRKNYFWDNKEWLFEHYWRKRLSTREMGGLVGVSSRLISKKMEKHKIERRPAKCRAQCRAPCSCSDGFDPECQWEGHHLD